MDTLQRGPVVEFGVGAIAQFAEPAPQVSGAGRGWFCLQRAGLFAGLLVDRLQLLALADAGLGVGRGLPYFFFRPLVESVDGFLKKRASREAWRSIMSRSWGASRSSVFTFSSLNSSGRFQSATRTAHSRT